ncbi:hypothetical protein ILFOPFJJ_06192 [Ensifer psoraleae]|nr:hypothetical protein [Sinorhizobium psoraleae]
MLMRMTIAALAKIGKTGRRPSTASPPSRYQIRGMAVRRFPFLSIHYATSNKAKNGNGNRAGRANVRCRIARRCFAMCPQAARSPRNERNASHQHSMSNSRSGWPQDFPYRLRRLGRRENRTLFSARITGSSLIKSITRRTGTGRLAPYCIDTLMAVGPEIFILVLSYWINIFIGRYCKYRLRERRR